METDAHTGREPDAPGAGPAPDMVLMREHTIVPDQQPVTVLEDLIHARGEQLLRAAVLLAGGQADGEDLLQAALERVFRYWRRIDGDPEGYLRRVLYHLAADGWRIARVPTGKTSWHAASELLRLGAEAEVLEPADLREKMAEMTQAMAARYRASRKA